MTNRVILKEFEVLNCSTEPDFFGGPEKVRQNNGVHRTNHVKMWHKVFVTCYNGDW